MSRSAKVRDVPWMPPETADAHGLVGVGGDLGPSTLLRAYAEGVFPWFNAGDPILWWSPDPRGVMEFDALHVSRSLAKTLRSGRFRVTADTAFEAVMRACGDTRPEGTWVTDEMIAGYTALHRLGHAHSVEVWHGDALAGGIYGVAVNALFAGESMFHHETDASKVALVALTHRLRERGYRLFDVQMANDHTRTMGVTEVPRAEYLARLRNAVATTGVTFTDPV